MSNNPLNDAEISKQMQLVKRLEAWLLRHFKARRIIGCHCGSIWNLSTCFFFVFVAARWRSNHFRSILWNKRWGRREQNVIICFKKRRVLFLFIHTVKIFWRGGCGGGPSSFIRNCFRGKNQIQFPPALFDKFGSVWSCFNLILEVPIKPSFPLSIIYLVNSTLF